MEEKNMPTNILQTIEQEMDSDIHPFLKKILDNIKPIGLAVGGIVAAVAVYSGMSTYQESQKTQAVSDLGAIMAMNDDTARLERLESFATSGHSDFRLAARLEMAKVFMNSGEYAKAAEAWRVISQSAGPEMKIVAGLGEAKALIAQEEYTKAIDVLTTIKKGAGDEFASVISSSLAFAAEKAGQKDLAIAEYESLKTKSEGNAAFLEHKINLLRSNS